MTEPDVRDAETLTWKDRLLVALRGLLLLAAVGLVALAIVNNGSPLEAGSHSPDGQFRSYDGRAWDLSRFEGKPLVVNFWATWCAPCMQELPHFARAAERHKDDVVFIGAAVSSPQEDVFRTIERFDVRYPIAAVDQRTVSAWNAKGLPSTYFLDKDHKVVWSTAGMLTAEQLESALETHLGIEGAR